MFKFIIFKEDEIKQSKIPCDQTVTFNWLFRRNWPFVVLCLAASDPWLPIRASNHFPWRTRLHRKKYSTTTTCKGKVRVDIINTRWKSVPNGYQNSEVCLCSISNWYQCVEVYSVYFSLKHNNNYYYYYNNNLYSAHILSSWRFTMYKRGKWNNLHITKNIKNYIYNHYITGLKIIKFTKTMTHSLKIA